MANKCASWEEYEGKINLDEGQAILLVRFDDPIIETGHKFTRAARRKKRRWGVDPPEEWGKIQPVIATEAIDVTVAEMHAYGHTFQQLGQGMTAGLVVEGLDDRDWDGWVFGDAEHESIAIVSGKGKK